MIFKPELNKPYTLSLKYKSAKEQTGRYGLQFLYTLSNGDALFVPPVAHQEIQSLNLSAEEPFILTKKADGAKVTWIVERAPQPAGGPQLVKPVDAPEPKPEASGVNRFYLDRATRLIDVYAAANEYAAEHHKGAVSKDDVRALCISVFIQCTPRPATANGGR